MDQKQQEIETYLKTTWLERQASRLRIDRGVCVLCGGKATVAHRRYGAVDLKETIHDLISLCALCEQKNTTHSQTVVDLRNQVQAKRIDKNNICPVCDQHVVERPVALSSREMLVLRELAAVLFDGRFVNVRSAACLKLSTAVKDYPSAIGDLVVFGLIEEEGSNRSMYRLTDLGDRFLKGTATVPHKIYMHNAREVGRDDDIMVSVLDIQ